MAAKHGNLSINSENIFPIIKKWLYPTDVMRSPNLRNWK